jgi:uncharacterized SAM-binding protein YcdF (DUF218 family)
MTATLSAAPLAKRTSRERWCLRIFLGVIGFLLLAASACYFFAQQVLTVDSREIKADALVVLGGGLPERAERAAELFKTGEAPLIICTGSGDAAANEAYLKNVGVPASAILLEPNARSTRQNAKFTITMLRERHVHSAIIVTSWYHSRRALACFEHYAPDLTFYSRPSYYAFSKSDWKPKGVSGYVKYEYVKLLGYWLCYGVCPF